MYLMDAICRDTIKFFKVLSDDTLALLQPSELETKETQATRITSVALKMVGITLAIFTTIAFLASLSLLTGSLSGIIFLGLAITTFIPSYDCIKIGTNMSDAMKIARPTFQSGITANISHIVTGLYNVYKAVSSEEATKMPYFLNNTLIARHLYVLCLN